MRFAHIADVHLGKQNETPELYAGFLNFVDYLELNPVDMVFITGDLFNHIPTVDDLAVVDGILTQLKDTDILYVTGECDCLERDNALWTYPFMSRTYVLNCEELHTRVKEEYRPTRNSYAEGIVDSLYFEKYNVDVYGICQYNKFNKRNDFDGVYAHNLNRINIFLGHGGTSDVNPFEAEDFRGKNFSYIGLGHLHQPKFFETEHVYYPGSVEPLDESESGQHGFIRGYVDKNMVRVKFVPIALRRFEEKKAVESGIDVSLLEDLNQSNAIGVALTRMSDSYMKNAKVKERAKEKFASMMLKELNGTSDDVKLQTYSEDEVTEAYGVVRSQLIEQMKAVQQGIQICEQEQQELEEAIRQCPDQTGTTNVLHEDINKLKFELDKLIFEDQQVDKKYSRRRLRFILWIDTPIAIALAFLVTFGPIDVFFLGAWNAWLNLIIRLFVYEAILTGWGFCFYNVTQKMRKRLFKTEIPVETHARLQNAIKELERRIQDLELVENSRFLDQDKYEENSKKLKEVNIRYQQLLELSEMNLLILGE